MLDVNEALRYMGASGADAELRSQMHAVASLAEAAFAPRWVWRASALEHRDGDEYLTDLQLAVPGRSARRMLAECSRAVLLVCTLGMTFDSRMRALQARDMAQAVMLDACGSALVEAGCDRAEGEIAARFPGMFLTDRFSPGYGDVPLEVQRSICQMTDSTRRLGVHVTDSCLMIPQKSVTAIIGLADSPQQARIRGCAWCAMRYTCELRKGGHRCEA